MTESPARGRNAPCPCGSGRKTKYCHGDPRRVGAAADSHDSRSDGTWGAFLDDTEVDFDPRLGCAVEPTKTWSAVMIAPPELSLFRRSAADLVGEFKARWGLSELHWHTLMNDTSVRKRVELGSIVEYAQRLATLLDDARAIILMQCASTGSFAAAEPLVEISRTVSGLRSGDRRDDSALFLLLFHVHSLAFGNNRKPAKRLL